MSNKPKPTTRVKKKAFRKVDVVGGIEVLDPVQPEEPVHRGGKFKKGNPGGPGGARPGSGRKPDALKRDIEAFTEALVKNPRHDSLEGEPEYITLYERAVQTTEKALSATDELGNVSPAAVRAAQLVLSYKLGRPRETLEIKGRARLDIVTKLSKIREAAIQKELSAQ